MIGLELMEVIQVETFGWSDAFETEKGVVFIDLHLPMTIEHGLSPLNSTSTWVLEDKGLGHQWKHIVRAMNRNNKSAS